MSGRVLGAMILLHLRKIMADKSNYFWLFGMPMMFSVLMGTMMGTFTHSGAKPTISIFDADRTAATESLIVHISEHEAYRVVVADTTGSSELARDLVAEGKRSATLFIPAGFVDSLTVAGGAELFFFHDADRYSAQSVYTRLTEEMLRVNARSAGRLAVGSDTFNPAAFDSLWMFPRLKLAASEISKRKRAGLALDNGRQHVGPGYTLMFVMMFMLMSVRDILEERRHGTLKRLCLGAASPRLLVAGMLIGPLVVGLLQMAILLILNSLFLGIDYGDSPAALALVALLFTSISTTLALLLATICRTPGQADGVGLTASMLLAALGGLWWPLEIVPDFMQKIGLYLPTGRAITIFHEMIGRGYGVAENLPHFLWLGGTLIILLILNVARSRKLYE